MSNKAVAKSIYDAFGPGGLLGAKAELDRTGYLSSEELAQVIEAHPDEPLPDWFRDYLVRRLRGQARKPTGPRPAAQDENQRTRLLMAKLAYKRAYRAARFLIANRDRIVALRRQTLPKAEATASELALAYVQKRLGSTASCRPDASTTSSRGGVERGHEVPSANLVMFPDTSA